MKLSQSPEAMEIKRRLREGMLGNRGKPFDAAEHNRCARQLAAQERWTNSSESYRRCACKGLSISNGSGRFRRGAS